MAEIVTVDLWALIIWAIALVLLGAIVGLVISGRNLKATLEGLNEQKDAMLAETRALEAERRHSGDG